MVENQAVMLATNDFYATATLLILLPIGIIWLVDPPKGPLTRVTTTDLRVERAQAWQFLGLAGIPTFRSFFP